MGFLDWLFTRKKSGSSTGAAPGLDEFTPVDDSLSDD